MITSQATPRIVLVTGATNGIGKVTALELARAGYRVLLTSRDAAKGRKVLDEIRTQSGNDALELFVGDLSSMADVRRIALEVRARHPKLDVLVNNAGGVFNERQTTVDGFETTFAFNHLAYFLLTTLLLEPLKAAGDARVVSVSSIGSNFGRMRWDDLEFRKGYSSFTAYTQSKLMNLLFANALARRLGGTGVTSNSLHPGVVRSGFGLDLRGSDKLLFNLSILSSVSPQKGAETSVYLATSPEVAGVSGVFFAKKRPRRANRIAYNEAAQERLWALSEHLLSSWLDPVESAPVEARA
ncbi:MAG: Short-chain dehydrogenase/reductase SDR? [uncultured Truepera sp.]|uniref:Short-chain dehydrogenase/reductase SDR n=1 Tax=uncultured Truepera sp. TaxID=543023 RepID=A0A6J4VDR7_9DEIN|nr:MAG: Short-chain dehydrogenase/reductase SDR? [uncultured Truepera sp.]